MDQSRSARISEWIARKKDSTNGAAKDTWRLIQESYDKKLWYQLTQALFNAINTDASFVAQSGGMREIYQSLLKDLELRVNPSRLADFAVLAAREYGENIDDAIKFLREFHKKIGNDQSALIMLKTAESELLMRAHRLEEAKQIIDEVRKVVESVTDVTPAHAYFYKTTSEYFRLQGTHSQYFRETLKYLGVVKVEQLPSEECRICAGRLAVAAIMAEDVYSFGELLVHPVLNSLKTPHDQWLHSLINALNSGDTKQVAALKPKWASDAVPELKHNEQIIQQKVRLMALIEMSYQRKPDSRVLKFDEVAEASNVNRNEVEQLLMKAMSVGLVRGEIDQVAEEFKLRWVKPRILSREQVSGLTKLLDIWCEDVDKIEKKVNMHGQDLILSAAS